MMLKKSRIKFVESEIVTYPTTQMMRNLLVVQVCAQIVVQILNVMCLNAGHCSIYEGFFLFEIR